MGTHAQSRVTVDLTYADRFTAYRNTRDPETHKGYTHNGAERRPAPEHASGTKALQRDKTGAHVYLPRHTDATYVFFGVTTDDPDVTWGFTHRGTRRHGQKKHAITWDN